MSSSEQKYYRATVLIERALQALREESARHEYGHGQVSDPDQLRDFEVHLQSILRELQSGKLPPRNERRFGMGQVIIDQWPIDAELGDALLRAEQAYRQL